MQLSVVSPPKLELKPLPDSHKYVFLGPKGTLPISLYSILSCDQEEELIHVMYDHNDAIRWSVPDMKGISSWIERD